MDNLATLFFIASIVFLIWILINLFRKKNKKKLVICFISSFIFFIIFSVIYERTTDKFDLGQSAFNRGNWNRAIEYLERIDTTDNKYRDSQLLLEKAKINLAEKQIQEKLKAAKSDSQKTNQLNETKSKTNQASIFRSNDNSESEDLSLYKKFKDQISLIELQSTVSIAKFQESAALFDKKQIARYDFYKMTDEAKKSCKMANIALNSLNVDSKIPKKVRSELNDAKMNLATAYMLKTDGLDEILKYLDENKMKHLQAFEDKIKQAQTFTNQSSIHLLKAQELIEKK